jgi:myo-inositol 2-dehydrogenase / D-chiro-inositol 1-dehydrogenase
MRSGPGIALALVGAGRMGRMHLRALAGSPAVQVACVVEPVAGVRDELASAGHRVHADLDELLAAPGRPDGILVAAPTDRHAALVGAALDAGLPVLCEKPAGLSAEQVARTGEAALAGGVLLQVAYWRRFVPELVALRERIAAGELGEVLHVVCAQWDGTPPPPAFRHSSGGIFVDMGVHEFDQLRFLTGQEIVGVRSASTAAVDPAARPDADGAQALLTLSGGATAVVSLGRHFPDGDSVSVEVFGTRGHERLTVLDPLHSERAQVRALTRQVEAFARAIRTGTTSGAGIDDAVAALRAAELCG